MSKVVKTVARVALPIVGNFIAPGIGGIIGGAVGGAMGGGGIKGALLGAAGGYLSSGAVGGLGNVLGGGAQAAGSLGGGIAQGAANVLAPSAGGGLLQTIGGGLRTLTGPLKTGFGTFGSLSNQILGIGNTLSAQSNADAAEKAARTQANAINRGIKANTAAQAPYTQLGSNAASQIQSIQADPAGYIQNNPLYTSLAGDAQRRLLANEAAKGKVGSGGTAAALQEQLLNLGNGLVQQQIGTLQNQVNTGAASAANVGNTAYQGNIAAGNANAAGQVGAAQAYNNGYQNQINTLLALQGLNRTPTYATSLSL